MFILSSGATIFNVWPLCKLKLCPFELYSCRAHRVSFVSVTLGCGSTEFFQTRVRSLGRWLEMSIRVVEDVLSM